MKAAGVLTASLALSSGVLAIEGLTIQEDVSAENVTDLGQLRDYPYNENNSKTYNAADYDWWVDENGNGKADVPGELVSPLGYYYRNCTDGAAYWSKVYNQKDISQLGDAKNWDDAAPGKGFIVKPGTANNIEIGDIAQSNDGFYGHVGFVTQVTKDSEGRVSKVKIAEMNAAGTGYQTHQDYASRNSLGKFSRSSSADWDTFIDVNGTGVGATAPVAEFDTQPAVVSRSTGTMDEFHTTPSGDLANTGWDASTGWRAPQVLTRGEVASNPAATSRSDRTMDVVFRSQNNNLRTMGWDANVGWMSPQTRVADGSVAGDPAIIHRNEGSVDVFYRNQEGDLVNLGWGALLGWSKTQTLVANDSLAGDPVAVARGEGAIEVFYRDKNQNMMSIGWDWRTGWGSPVLRATGIKGDPAAVSRTESTMDAFYRTSNDGLGNAGWDPTLGWRTQLLVNSGVRSNPAAVVRDSNSMNVVYVDEAGSLKERGWTASNGWTSLTHRGTGLTRNPSMVARTSGNLDVFAKDAQGGLSNTGWDWRTGWTQQRIATSGVR